MSFAATSKSIPTVSRVAGDTLVELVYDPVKRSTALVVSRFGGLWNIEQEVQIGNELLVPYSATNNLIANDCVQLPSMPVEFGFKSELLAEIQAFLHRYVDLSPLFEEIATHYVLLTWVYDRFGEVPYLRLRGTFGTGKTRALLAIGSLCNKGFFASGASTISPIFHTLDAFGGTLILDEADLPFSDAKLDMVKLLNNGTVQGLPVLRTIINRHREFNPAAFKVFGPKIVAMRAPFEDQALESRFLTEETGSRRMREDVPIHLPKTLKTEALALRNKLLHFRLCEYFNINTNPSLAVKGVEPRLNQTALSLLSIVDDLEARARIQANLVERSSSMREDQQRTIEGAIVRAAYTAMKSAGDGPLPLRHVVDAFNSNRGDHAFASSKSIGHFLRSRLRIATRRTGGVYVLDRAAFTVLSDAAARLGIVEDASN